jgi:hypothetical protein
MFNVKEPGATKPDGKKQWTPHGRVFVRLDLSGGGAWLGPKEAETEYVLVPRNGAPKGTFEVMEKLVHEGATVLKPYARLFIRSTFKGGALWVGARASEKEYALFPAEAKPTPQGAAAPQPASA